MPDSLKKLIGGLLVVLSLQVTGKEGGTFYTAEELRSLAESRDLWTDHYWQLLLHVKPGIIGACSAIDDPDFFLSPQGKTDARYELLATLTALAAAPDPEVEHAFDRFPARCEWLVETLQLDRTRLPVPNCREIDDIIDSIDPRAAVMVFPNAYMNTPASMFGHTLLAIRGTDPELLNQAVNYSAFTPETNGFLFAFKGVFGLYDGFYSVTPYYQKIQEYNDMNMRDIWEYELNLTRPELERMMRHIWELHEISAKYYFFSENCSYNLLILLDLARPGNALYKKSRPWVVPLDTVKLIREKHLLAGVRYRPSRATQVRALGVAVGADNQALAVAIANGEISPKTAMEQLETPLQRARVIDLATAFLQARRAKKQLDKDTYSKRFLKCLSVRSRLEVDADAAKVPIPPPAAPDDGHGSFRVGIGRGRDDGRNFTRLQLRPAYHSLDDPQRGYLPGAEVQFANLSLLVEDGTDQLEYERLEIIRIRSLSFRDSFFKPVSWEVNAAFKKDWTAEDDRRHFADFGLGFGGTWKLPRRDTMLFVIPRCELRMGDFDHAYSLGGGFKAGLWGAPFKRCRLGVETAGTQFFAGDCYEDISASLNLTVSLTRGLAIYGRMVARTVNGGSRDGFELSLRGYF